MTRRTDGARFALASVQVASGAATILRAPDVARRPWLGLSSVGMARIVRILGARQLAQGVVTGLAPDPAVLTIGGGTDLLHGLSMIPIAAGHGPYRRPAAISAALAGAAALTGILTARAARRD